MRPAWLVLLVVAMSAGCASTPPSTITVPLTDEAARAEAGAACAALDCSWEWWNLTVEGAGLHSLRVPLPAVVTVEGADPHADMLAWHRNLSSEGVVGSVGLMAHPAVSLSGEGPATLRTHRLTVAPPGRHAESFLWARWGMEANQTRPHALPVHLVGGVDAVRVTYEAHSSACRRSAEFTLAGPLGADGVVWLPGRDAGACA